AADGNSVDVIASYLVGSTSDLVFANEGQDVRLYPFAGGAYGPAMILSNASPNVTSLAAADIDGDTDNDLLIGNNPGPIQLVRFEAGAPLGLESIPGTEGSTVNALLLRDFDADGDKDLLAGTDGVDLLYFNDGTGHFEQQPMPSPHRRTTALDASFQCEGCIDVAAAGDDGVGEYQNSRQAIYVAVIDPVTGSLEFSSFFDGGGLENTFRGLTLVADGHFLLAGETDGAAWPVIGTSQMGATGRSDAVFIEVDIDVDDDGVLDGSDNCLEVANPAQRDTDGDSFGNYCDGDFNNDGAINFADLTVMKSVFFSGNPNADLNGDGAVNFADLTLLKAQFFGAPGPSGLLLP
ncbi:MAG: hypothetical protein HKN49_09990, partial [Gammaproteobacteria bacterium]|nr:hypothetical protein [Gammaproteobacteria bacterium]